MVGCDCQQHKDFVDDIFVHVLTGDLRIIPNSKLRKLVRKSPNFREVMSINWNKFKREIEIGLISISPKVMTENILEWKRKIFQEAENKTILLKHRIKVHKKNLALKQDTVTQCLNELHEKYVFVSQKAANNIAIICEKYYIILKEIRISDV